MSVTDNFFKISFYNKTMSNYKKFTEYDCKCRKFTIPGPTTFVKQPRIFRDPSIMKSKPIRRISPMPTPGVSPMPTPGVSPMPTS
jgi:hypothetical protein